MKRLNNWPGLLAKFIEERRFTPFAWGVNDCCLFSADGIHKAILGVDYASEFRGTYDSALGAARIFEKYGGLEFMVSEMFTKAGFPESNPNLAQRGDPVIYVSPEYGATLGLCVGPDAAFVAEKGLGFIRMSKVKKAWRL